MYLFISTTHQHGSSRYIKILQLNCFFLSQKAGSSTKIINSQSIEIVFSLFGRLDYFAAGINYLYKRLLTLWRKNAQMYSRLFHG